MMSNGIFLTSILALIAVKILFAGFGQVQPDSGWMQKDCNGKRE